MRDFTNTESVQKNVQRQIHGADVPVMSQIIRTEENSQLFSFQSGSLCLSCFSPALFVLDLDFYFFFYRPGFEGSCERKQAPK